MNGALQKIECMAGSISYNDQGFLILKEVDSEKEHGIPISQLYNAKIVKGKKYQFYKQYDDLKKKTLLTYIHPGFEIGVIREFEIETTVREANTDYFLIKNNIGCAIRVRAFDIQHDCKKIKCEIIGYKRGVPLLKNIDSKSRYYTTGQEYDFEILDFCPYKDVRGFQSNGITIKDNASNEISMSAKPWQLKELWTFSSLKCVVTGYDKNCVPILKNTDDRHPKFHIGQLLKFKITGFDEQVRLGHSPRKFVKLVDVYGCSHQLFINFALLGKLGIGDNVECILEQITYRLHLKLSITNDPYFYEFSEIIKEKNLERKYFTSQLSAGNLDPDVLQMKKQYDSKSAFYILTFCNRVIPKIFKNFIDRLDYRGAIEVNDLLISIEEWILNKGIIQAFPNESTKRITKDKVKTQIKRATIIAGVLPHIHSGELKKFFQKDRILLVELYYIFSFTDIRLIDALDFIRAIGSIRILEKSDEFFLEKFNNVLRFKNRSFKNKEGDFLVLFDKSGGQKEDDYDQFYKWTYFQVIILDILKRNSESNLLKAQLLRYYSTNQGSLENRSAILKYAFSILNNSTCESIQLPIILSGEDIKIDFEDVNNPNNSEKEFDGFWKEINDTAKNDSQLSILITKKNINGYDIVYNGIQGFLPLNHINDLQLRNYALTEIFWETTVNITNFSKEFNYFIAKQLPTDNPAYISINRNKTPKLNSIVRGTVKSVTKFGIFLSTKYGEGLLPTSKISDQNLNEVALQNLFKLGSEITVQVINIVKLSFSYKALTTTAFAAEYDAFIQRIYSYQSDIDVEDFEVEKEGYDVEDYIGLEKGYIFEQFAASLTDLDAKINYIELARQFFSNHKSARSYLLNIYIDYFKSLKLLNNIIDNFSFEKYELLKDQFKKIKTKIEPKTLDNFAGTDRLIYFIDILTLFNETSSESFEELYNYSKSYSDNEEGVLLKIIAKIALSNNLLLSETSKDENFSLKNLKRINDYIKNGVFSLKESESDRLERELDSKRKYWKGIIQEDEGANLEFKSSFLKPIPNKKRQDQIESLRTKVKNSPNPHTLEQKIDEINRLNVQKAIIHSAFKTIAAFANTSGGRLLIGVTDDKEIYGLEEDYKYFKKSEEQSRDGFGKLFDSKLKEYFGESFSSILLKKQFLKFPEGDILIIEVEASTEEVFLLKDSQGNKSEHIFVRNLSSTEKLDGIELARFIREKYRKQIFSATENTP